MLSKSAKQLLRSHTLRGTSQQYFHARSASVVQPFEFYKNGVYKAEHSRMPLPNTDINTLAFPRWEKWSKLDALECLTTGQKLTYGQLLDASLRFGGALVNLKVNMDPDVVTLTQNKEVTIPPRVSILSPNVIEYAPVVYGTFAAGCCIATINSNYKVGEIMHNLKDVKPRVLVVHPSWEDLADQALSNLNMNIPVLTIGHSKKGKPNLQEILNDSRTTKIDPKKINPADVGYIFYSGGTTGLPKGVATSHSAMTNNIDGMTDPRIYPFGIEDPQQTVIGLMPFYHGYGMIVIMTDNLYLGSKILVINDFDKNSFGRIIEEHQIKFLHIVPTLLNFLINSPEVTTKHLSSVKGVIIAAAPVLPSSAKALEAKIDHDIQFQEGYGMTEILCSHLTPRESPRIGFCGKLISDTEAKIIDLETQEPLGPGKKGELVIKGTGIMSHYLNNPKATAETIDEEGFLHTGDVAMCTEDGYFSIIDRIKELIKVKAFQVSPAEIEDVLMSHPAVAEAGVIGIPDERMGERPRAYVALKGKVSKQELLELVEKNLASYKALTGGIEFLDSLPKAQSGKILRKDLKSLALESL